jgi:hypothetical protein
VHKHMIHLTIQQNHLSLFTYILKHHLHNGTPSLTLATGHQFPSPKHTILACGLVSGHDIRDVPHQSHKNTRRISQNHIQRSSQRSERHSVVDRRKRRKTRGREKRWKRDTGVYRPERYTIRGIVFGQCCCGVQGAYQTTNPNKWLEIGKRRRQY